MKNATAAAKVPEGDEHQSGLVSFRLMANTVWNTDKATDLMRGLATPARPSNLEHRWLGDLV